MRTIRSSQRGISMIEILVTLLIISLAMLGAVGLQMQALKLNQGGQFRSQAVFLAGDLVERLEANKDSAIAGDYNIATALSTPANFTKDCKGNMCTSTELARFDLYHWGTAIKAVLPQATWKIEQTTTGNPSTFDVTITWVDRVSNTTRAASDTTETFSYKATRTVQTQ